MTRDELARILGGTAAAGTSAVVVPVPDPVRQAFIAAAAAAAGWLVTLGLNWLKRRLGG